MSARGSDEGAPVALSGVGVSPGVAEGRVYLVTSRELRVETRSIGEDEIEHEICRLEDALIETRRQIRSLQRDLEERTTSSDTSILDAHLMVLDDRVFIEEVVTEVREKQENVESVVYRVAGRYADALAAVKDDYLRERVSDIRDVARRVIQNLRGGAVPVFNDIREASIVVAPDLAPSETAGIRRDVVVGFATDLGSSTSHTAVMARALRIPAVVGLHDVTRRVRSGDYILMDGNRGTLIVNPSDEQLRQYGKMAEERRTIQDGLRSLRDEPAVTKDGHRIVLSANTEGSDELDAVVESGAEGVGLFRSEYLYLYRDKVVSEEEQAKVYREIAERLKPAPVILRTLDLGGDKLLTESDGARETNPFLGARSIRYSLAHPDKFRSQLRAILRASATGNVKIMYPMICKASEVVAANKILEKAKQDLRDAGELFDEEVEVGVMIEIPSAALTADLIAKHVSFFSLGTNDLIQYALAVDRVNERVAYLYEPTHPGVLKLIKSTIDAGHRHGIWVGLCGEMAADPVMVPLLLGLGVDELSVAPSLVLLVKDAVRKVEMSQARELAERALACESGGEVLALCRQLTEKVVPELLELL